MPARTMPVLAIAALSSVLAPRLRAQTDPDAPPEPPPTARLPPQPPPPPTSSAPPPPPVAPTPPVYYPPIYPPPPAPAWREPREPEPQKPEHPPAHEGIQLALRIGASLPFGKATSEAGDDQRARYGSQAVYELDLGVKLSAPIYLGGYAAIGAGSEGDDSYTRGLCDSTGDGTDVDCSAGSSRVGLELQYHFIPDGFANPWVGYGLGYEWAWQSIEDRYGQRTEESSVRGFQYGRIQLGVDFRLGEVIGIGPYFSSEIGRYTHATSEVNGRQTHSGAIDGTAIHGWYGLGVRLVFFP